MKKLKEYKFHELCLLFPLLPDEELGLLADDIKKNGLLNPIIKYKSVILDGRNRLLACLKAGIEPIFREISSEAEADKFVGSMNLKRRHIETAAKRIELGFKLEEWRKKQKNNPEIQDKNMKEILTNNENKRIAKRACSNPETVAKVRKIMEKAIDDPKTKTLFEKAKAGKKSIEAVYKEIENVQVKPKKIRHLNLPAKPTVEELQEELRELKIEKQHYESLYKKVKEIAIELRYWKDIIKALVIVVEEKEDVYPSIKQLREAGLI